MKRVNKTLLAILSIATITTSSAYAGSTSFTRNDDRGASVAEIDLLKNAQRGLGKLIELANESSSFDKENCYNAGVTAQATIFLIDSGYKVEQERDGLKQDITEEAYLVAALSELACEE